MTAKYLPSLLAVCALTSAASWAQIKPLNYHTPSYIEFNASEAVVDEDAGTVTLFITRTGEFRWPSRVEYVTSEIEASEGQDYAGSGGTVVFQGGEGFKSISIPIVADLAEEGDETFQVNLSSDDPNVVLFRSTLTVTIKDKTVTIAETPRLDIAPANKSVVLSWAATSETYQLERCGTCVSGGAWEPVNAPVETAENQNRVTLPMDSAIYFYRLTPVEL